MPQLPKHHYLPVFYLKQWAGPDGRLCEFSKPYNQLKPRMTHPDGTGYERGLYSFEALPPEAAEWLERGFFDQTDDIASRALRMLRLGNIERLEAAIKSAWSRFIMTLLHRSPESVRRAKERVMKGPTDDLQGEYERVKGPDDPPTYAEFRERLSDAVLQRTVIVHLQNIMDSRLVGEALNRMIWAVTALHKPRNNLLTCDRPIVMTNGMAQPGAHLVLPISPDQVFFAANTKETMRKLDEIGKRGDLPELLNDRMARQARKYVYGTDDRQLRFVANRFGEKMRWSPFE